ncbi:hypothetical protein M406DRAFT_357083 [Cryphonectria parasitica EP155]|uniref:Uncharacterized protein n=1 Tax=Cryphonectria parasitica (strain ATCC 38755 / EP155) TaxID=660469 RepID=A0A9P4XYV3_CRYP1|nr:uncharacterized protein M406DRAFT_357083 [Cryphonectria parasitica EP155]KAF3763424.1 hypothetical protein M406DRAFT_357083 [Cryphonectria parasitica EP155]
MAEVQREFLRNGWLTYTVCKNVFRNSSDYNGDYDRLRSTAEEEVHDERDLFTRTEFLLVASASDGNARKSLIELLREVRSSDLQCQYTRDKCFGVLAMVDWEGEAPLMPDYENDDFEVVVEVLEVMQRRKTCALTIPTLIGTRRWKKSARYSKCSTLRFPPQKGRSAWDSSGR